MIFTADVVKFSARNAFVLTLTSIASIAGFLWPFLFTGSKLPHLQVFFMIAVALAFLLTAIEISNSALDAKSIALLGVLAALIAALRPLGAGAVGIEPMWFLLILCARVFGPSFGFLLGMISVFVSALLTGGLGPWLGYQVFAAAWIGLLAGLLPGRTTLRGKGEIALLALFGVISAEIFGILMDLQFWPWALGGQTQLSYSSAAPLHENIAHFFTFHFLSAMAWDIPRALFTAGLILFAGSPVLHALRRAYVRAAFLTPIEFIEREKEQTAA